jgi:hypothetical protein
LIVALVVAALVLIAVLAIWRRVAGTRVERHSMENYEHALGVLGDAALRPDRSKTVRFVPPDEVARAHIRPTDGPPGSLPPPVHLAEDVPPPRIRLEPPVLPGTPPRGIPAVSMSSDVDALAVERGRDDRAAAGESREPGSHSPRRAGRHLRGEGERRRRTPASQASGGSGASSAGGELATETLSPEWMHRERTVRRLATGAMAAVAVAAVAVAGLQLAGGGGPAKGAGRTTTTTRPKSSGTATHSSTPTTVTSPSTSTSTIPTTFTPQTSSATDVSYRAPTGSYSVSFAATGPCWIGVERSTGGAWVWEKTLQAGQQETYNATGTTIVRVGAPPYIKVSINGITVQLLPSNTQPYDLTFSTS